MTIENNGANIKVTENGLSRYIFKGQIREIEVLRGTIIRIDIGQGALRNLFVDQANVTAPISNSVTDLRDQIIAMLAPAANNNDANEALEIAALNGIAATMTNLQTKVDSLDSKVFFEPKIVDESDANVVYNGYALPGALPEQSVWAIQKVSFRDGLFTYEWAGGNKQFDKKWSDRTTLIYS